MRCRPGTVTVRGGHDAISPSRFPDWTEISQIKTFADEVRDHTGGIPIGYKLSAQHIEKDIDAALTVGCDYVIIDGRGGATGAAPRIFRDNISVPTIPALARARRHLDRSGREDVTLIITGGLRTPADFAKALALGADAIAIANAAIQAIGCLGMRACHTNNCPVGIATQKPHLVARLIVDESAQRLARFLETSVELMKILARACGHTHLNQFSLDDLVTWKEDMSLLAGVPLWRGRAGVARSPDGADARGFAARRPRRCPLQSQPAQSVTRYRRPMTELLCAPADATDEANGMNVVPARNLGDSRLGRQALLDDPKLLSRAPSPSSLAARKNRSCRHMCPLIRKLMGA